MDQRGPLRRAYEEHNHQGILDAIRANTVVSVTGCWLWSRKTKDGYATTAIAGKTLQVHRLALEAKHRRPLGTQVAHHICAVTHCVNPDHLQPVTHRENVAEMLARQSYLARIRELEEALAAVDPTHHLLRVIQVA